MLSGVEIESLKPINSDLSRDTSLFGASPPSIFVGDLVIQMLSLDRLCLLWRTRRVGILMIQRVVREGYR